jgi:hypothetical protein
MFWYLSYKNGQKTVMRIFRNRDEAIKQASYLLPRTGSKDLRVGPMLGQVAGEVLDETEIRRISENAHTA